MRLDTQRYRKDLTYPNRHGYGTLPSGVGPTRPQDRIKAILIHTTNNPKGNTHFEPEAQFLLDSAAVSCHYVVSSHDDTVVQLLPDTTIAWHAGDCADNDYENATSIGIEIAWTINKGPLPPIAIANVTALVRDLLARYPSITKIDMHRAQAIPAGRKVDPSGWATADFYRWRGEMLSSHLPLSPPGETQPGAALLSEHTTILSAPRCTLEQLGRYILARPHGEYVEADITRNILPAYWRIATGVGVDPLLAVAQMIHETGSLTSWWSQRPRRNPAGIGVTGDNRASRPTTLGWAFDRASGLWKAGVSFPTWADDAIPAHVGRLLAYATKPGERTPEQMRLVARAMGYRALPDVMHGSAPTLRPLGKAHNPTGQGWASPGTDYGQRIADVANRIRGL